MFFNTGSLQKYLGSSIFVTGDNHGVDTPWVSHLADIVGHSIGTLACFFVDSKRILLVTQIVYDMQINKIYCVYTNESVHRKERLVTTLHFS